MYNRGTKCFFSPLFSLINIVVSWSWEQMWCLVIQCFNSIIDECLILSRILSLCCNSHFSYITLSVSSLLQYSLFFMDSFYLFLLFLFLVLNCENITFLDGVNKTKNQIQKLCFIGNINNTTNYLGTSCNVWETSNFFWGAELCYW
jgi:hypothetical protein